MLKNIILMQSGAMPERISNLICRERGRKDILPNDFNRSQRSKGDKDSSLYRYLRQTVMACNRHLNSPSPTRRHLTSPPAWWTAQAPQTPSVNGARPPSCKVPCPHQMEEEKRTKKVRHGWAAHYEWPTPLAQERTHQNQAIPNGKNKRRAIHWPNDWLT